MDFELAVGVSSSKYVYDVASMYTNSFYTLFVHDVLSPSASQESPAERSVCCVDVLLERQQHIVVQVQRRRLQGRCQLCPVFVLVIC